MPLFIETRTELFEAAVETPTLPTVKAIDVIATAITFFFETMCMVLSFLASYWPTTPRYRLPVINTPRIKKVAHFPVSRVRVLSAGLGVKPRFQAPACGSSLYLGRFPSFTLRAN